MPDGQKVIVVGLVEIIGGHELMAGNSPHRPQDHGVVHATGFDLGVDHGISLLCIGLRVGDRVTGILHWDRVAGILFGGPANVTEPRGLRRLRLTVP